jgi:cardiolipin synthase
MLKHIPNILTIIRFLLIPIIVLYIFTGNYILAFVFFTISGLTDIADGFIARKFNFVSNFGKLMDPLADKLNQIATLTSLAMTKIIPIWILLIVLLKEFIMICGASFLYGKDVVVYSKWYGKLATVLFYIAIVVSLLLKQFELTGIWENLDLGLFTFALFATIFSLIMYVKDLYQKGFIDKQDLKKEVTVDKKEKKKK